MHKKRICIFIGPPGAGKGSLSARCVQELGYQQLSTGNLCRRHIAEATDIGKKIDFAIKCGRLISDSLIVEMIYQWMVENEQDAHSIIFDGCPRTIAQARILYELFQKRYASRIRIDVVHLAVSEYELFRRILGRAICSNRKCQAVYSCNENSGLTSVRTMVCDLCDSPLIKRTDDTEDALKKRLEQYFEHEKELLEFYHSVGILPFMLQGGRPLDVVFAELKSILIDDYH